MLLMLLETNVISPSPPRKQTDMSFTCTHVPPQIEIILPRNPRLPKILIPPPPPRSLFAIHWGFVLIWVSAFIYFRKKGTLTSPALMYTSYEVH